MAEKLLLVNPAKPPSKRKRPVKKASVSTKKTRATSGRKSTAKKKVTTMARKKRRTAAQKAATRKLVALNKRKGSKRTVARKSTTTRRRTNPIKRRATRAVAPARRTRRRNPIQKGLVNRVVMPAVTAAGGAVALDVVWSYLPLPTMVKVGPMRHLFKLAGAVGLGWLAGNVVSKRTADAVTLGAATVVIHNAMSEMLARFAPQIQQDNAMGFYTPALPAGSIPHPSQKADMGYYAGNNTPASDPTMGYYANKSY